MKNEFKTLEEYFSNNVYYCVYIHCILYIYIYILHLYNITIQFFLNESL